MKKEWVGKPGLDLTGCIAGVLSLGGILLVALGTVGFVLGLFGRKFRYKGMDMGIVDLETYLIELAVASFLFGIAYGIDYLQRRKRNKNNSNIGS